jgi:hypothetical protein
MQILRVLFTETGLTKTMQFEPETLVQVRAGVCAWLPRVAPSHFPTFHALLTQIPPIH